MKQEKNSEKFESLGVKFVLVSSPVLALVTYLYTKHAFGEDLLFFFVFAFSLPALAFQMLEKRIGKTILVLFVTILAFFLFLLRSLEL